MHTLFARTLKATLLIGFAGIYTPQAYAQQAPLFSEVPAKETGVFFDNKLVESAANNIITYEYFYNGGGVALADFNLDGLTDLYFSSNQQENKLYLNKGRWKFEDITSRAGVAGRKGWKTGVSVADVNGDGFPDIYVCYSGDLDPELRENQLFINNGDGTFTDRAKALGVANDGYSTQAAFFDFDKDGDLDLFVINHNIKNLKNFDAAFVKKMKDPDAGDFLYRNDGGVFVDITASAGIIANPIGYGLGVQIADINNDGWPDMYVSNDYVEQDYLYINQHDGTFREALNTYLGHLSNFSMGVDIADINNDGWLDIFTLDMLPETNKRQKLLYTPDNYELYDNALKNGFYHQIMRNMLQLNNGNGTFSEIGQLAGVSNTDWSWAALLADFNNDGFRDLFVSNGYGRDMINMDFMKFYADERLKHNLGEKSSRMFSMLQSIKSTPLHNYIFENNRRLQFIDRSTDWGFAEENFSHGAAYADLDNDGDLDLVVNRMNQTAGIYRNMSREHAPEHHYLAVSLQMPGKNTFALGARVQLFAAGTVQTADNYPLHGFQSSMLTPLHFGFDAISVDSLIITWPDGGRQTVREPIQADQMVTYVYAPHPPAPTPAMPAPVFAVAPENIPFEHREDLANDFKIQPLMPNMLSFAGPRLAATDIDRDGRTDVFVCGARGQAGAVLMQTADGGFLPQVQRAFDADKLSEDTDACFLDADGDGDQDLYVVSGGYQLPAGDPAYQDRLYRNDNGVFVKTTDAIPVQTGAGGCVTTLDFDNDGDLDLFVGGRVVPGRYPDTPESMLLQNDGKGHFANVTATLAPDLRYAGMVTDAVWTDLDKDGRSELIVCGEWMPLLVFGWWEGRMTDISARFFEKKLHGWWNCLTMADMDKDGDPDLIAGNWGRNSQLKADADRPMTLYAGDFDNNGAIDPILSYYIENESFPMASREEMLDQMVSLRQKFPTFDAYSEAKVADILSAEQLASARVLRADYLQTALFENRSGKMRLQELPVEADETPVYAISTGDFDGDGLTDILLGGNVEHTRVRLGKSDACYGLLLKGDGKWHFSAVPQLSSGLQIKGCIRDILPLENRRLLIGRNDARPLILKY